MANTAEGKRLTEKHRQDQIRVAERTERRIKGTSRLVSVEDLDGSWRWRLEVQRIVEDEYNKSQRIASTYVDQYSLVESGGVESQIKPQLDKVAVDESIRINGIVGAKSRIKQGALVQSAVNDAIKALAASSAQFALAGGRDLIDVTVRYSGRAGGYRRVTDGRPCAFCAMLASRGPVYVEQTAFFESHRHCGCSAEIVYGEWEPNALEAKWAASYKYAAGLADDAGESRVAPARTSGKERDNILWRMRRATPDLFHDGVTPKS